MSRTTYHSSSTILFLSSTSSLRKRNNHKLPSFSCQQDTIFILPSSNFLSHSASSSHKPHLLTQIPIPFQFITIVQPLITYNFLSSLKPLHLRCIRYNLLFKTSTTTHTPFSSPNTATPLTFLTHLLQSLSQSNTTSHLQQNL